MLNSSHTTKGNTITGVLFLVIVRVSIILCSDLCLEGSMSRAFNKYTHREHDHGVLFITPGSKLCTTFLNIAKNDEIQTKSKFTGTAIQPHFLSI